MRNPTTTYAANLSLAQDRAQRDRSAADVRRRLQTGTDTGAETLETAEPHGVRAAVAHVLGILPLRRVPPTA